MRRRPPLLAAGLVAAVIVYGCTTNTSVTTIEVISKIAGDSQVGIVGTVLPVRPAVRITDADSLPVVGETVVFALTSIGGSISGGTVTTGADGVATSGDWKLGSQPGSYSVSAGVSNATVHFVATAIADTLPRQTGSARKP